MIQEGRSPPQRSASPLLYLSCRNPEVHPNEHYRSFSLALSSEQSTEKLIAHFGQKVEVKQKKKSPGGDAVKVKAINGFNKPSKCCRLTRCGQI